MTARSFERLNQIIEVKTLLPERIDMKKLVVQYFGTYSGGDPINGFSYLADADLNSDGRINGDDHTLASLVGDEPNYDIESFAYDKNGNRTQLVQNGDAYTYQYGDRNRLEAIFVKRKNETSVKLYIKFEYDLNGNTILKTLFTAQGEVKTGYEYDTLNRLVKTTEATKVTDYLYDNAGNRFIKKGSDGTTLYLRHGQMAVAMDIELPPSDPVVKGKINRYVMSGEFLAGRFTRVVNKDGTGTMNVSYYHLDHLNSTKCTSNASGEVEVRYIYRAFGSQLAKLGTGDARYTYGGKQLDDETNLYYFNARFYDAEIGRFITEDPAKDGLNWYIYCKNNPLKFIDPTGLEIITYGLFTPNALSIGSTSGASGSIGASLNGASLGLSETEGESLSYNGQYRGDGAFRVRITIDDNGNVNKEIMGWVNGRQANTINNLMTNREATEKNGTEKTVTRHFLGIFKYEVTYYEYTFDDGTSGRYYTDTYSYYQYDANGKLTTKLSEDLSVTEWDTNGEKTTW